MGSGSYAGMATLRFTGSSSSDKDTTELFCWSSMLSIGAAMLVDFKV